MKTNEIYAMVTDRIINELKKGIIPWFKPWTGANGAYSRATGRNYSLLNQWLMPEGEYATFNQVKKEGGNIIKGSKGYPVVFWKIYKKEETDPETGEKVLVNIPCLKYYTVFNIETQTDLEKKHNRVGLGSNFKPIEAAEKVKDNYIEGAGIGFREVEGDRAYYEPFADRVTLPMKAQFVNVAEYYSTLFHEFAHSTGHKSRLNRGLETAAGFGSEDYSREELVAELTSCGILANLGIETKTSFRNNAAYIQSWLEALKNDNKMIVWASGRAEKAYDLIMGYTDNLEESGAESPDPEGTTEPPVVATEEEKEQTFAVTLPKKESFYRMNTDRTANLCQGYTVYVTDGKKSLKLAIAKNPHKANYWDVTSVDTGMLVLPHCFKTRKEAVEALEKLQAYAPNTPDVFNKLCETVESVSGRALAEIIKKAKAEEEAA